MALSSRLAVVQRDWAGLAAAVSQLALRTAGFGTAAGVVGDGEKAWKVLRGQNPPTPPEEVTAAIESELARELSGLHDLPSRRDSGGPGTPRSDVTAAADQIATLFTTLVDDHDTVVAAVHDPAGFPNYIAGLKRTRTLERGFTGPGRTAFSTILLAAATSCATHTTTAAGHIPTETLRLLTDLHHDRPHLRPPPILAGVPPLTRLEVPRPDLTDPLRHQLLAAANHHRGTDGGGHTGHPGLDCAVVVGVAGVAALRGAGGFGKSTIARLLANDRAVQDAFPGGLVWVQFSEHATRDADITATLNDSSHAFLSHPPRAAGVRGATDDLTTTLRAVVSDRGAVLLMVDDVWADAQLAPYITASHRVPGVVLLVTTRNASLLPKGVDPVRVDRMTPAQATDLLLQGLDPDLRRNLLEQVEGKAMVGELERATGRWALLLGLLNANLRRRGPSTVAKTVTVLAELHDRLTHGGVTDLDPTNPQHRHDAVSATLAGDCCRVG